MWLIPFYPCMGYINAPKELFYIYNMHIKFDHHHHHRKKSQLNSNRILFFFYFHFLALSLPANEIKLVVTSQHRN